MSIRLFFLVCLFGIASISPSIAKPNILFIFADDMAYDTFGPDEDPQIQTPHLDRLANQGTRFTHCFNMGSWSGAVCVASRSMLNTGKTLWRAHAFEKDLRAQKKSSKGIDEKVLDIYWSKRMSRLGYETYFSGKWHVSVSANLLFDNVANIRPGMPKDSRSNRKSSVGYHRPIEGQIDAWDAADPKFGGFWEGGKHWSEVLAEDAIGFLKTEGEKLKTQNRKPFFMYLAFNAPHDPRQSPQSFLDRYPLKKIKMPLPFFAKYPFQTSGLHPTLRDEALAPFPRTEYAVKVHRREYYAIITHMDEQIGRILSELERQGLRENTWIFFTSDHGLACGRHGLFGKQNMYDHSTRVPFLIIGPKAKADVKISTPIFLQDLMATSLELAGDLERHGIEFRSLLPIVKGKKEKPSPIYTAYLQTQRAIRHAGWKLILYPQIKVKRLYHYAQDPFEMRDRAGESSQVSRMKSLFKLLQKEQKRWEDEIPLADFYPELAD